MGDRWWAWRARNRATFVVAASVCLIVLSASLAGCSRSDDEGDREAARTTSARRGSTNTSDPRRTSTTPDARSSSTPPSNASTPPGDTTTPTDRTTGADRTTGTETSPNTEPGPIGSRDAGLGYSLDVPTGWQLGAQIVATAFASDAECRSVEVVDAEPGPGTGPGASILHSFVQVCARPLDDPLGLEDFLRQIYGDAFERQFHPGRLGGLPTYRAGDDATGTSFVQTAGHRVQVVTAVVASPETRQQRVGEVRRVLDRLRFDS